MRKNALIWGLLACASAIVGCTGNNGVTPGNDAAVVDGGSTVDMGTAPVDMGVTPVDTGIPPIDMGIDGGPPLPAYCPPTQDFGAPPTCPALATRTETTITGDMNGDQTWDCNHTYHLTGPTFWRTGTLTIQPGTHIIGDLGSFLIMTVGSTLNAVGHPAQPIVFTSSEDDGSRDRGDWGGLVMLGDAPINITGGHTNIEGIPATDSRGTYGGTNMANNCGHLRFVRIEFAGYELTMDNELNGLTLGGCGTGTLIEWTQSHRGSDDAIEVFGGAPNLHHIVCSGYDDDGFDWDQGYSGNAQYLVLHHYPDAIGSADPNGFEADNNRTDNALTPISNPTIYNATLIGTHDASVTASIGMVLRRGTHGSIHNTIVTGWGRFGIDVRDMASTDAAGTTLTVTNSIIFGNTLNFEAASPELTAFTATAAMNRIDMDPMLVNPFATDGTVNYTAPATSIAATGAVAPPSGGFFGPGNFVGAIGPGCPDWTQGWTSYPVN
jgi:hypothetical protein